jgi:hypothetical protein
MRIIEWNCITDFSRISNGVRQGGIISSTLFCAYLDGLSSRLIDARIGCFMGRAFVGVLMYADDKAIIAPTPLAMRMMLAICDSYANVYSLNFNANKSKCLYYPYVSNYHCTDEIQLPHFTIAGNCPEYVDN